jgi:predicted Fe-Mo cluster-binding NifX family protein
MKVALPIWDERISPVFDVARKLRLVEVEDGSLIGQIDHRIESGAHASMLSELGVEVLICSAISRALEAIAWRAGVEVIPDICGDVDEVIKAYLLGNLADTRFASPCHSRDSHRDRPVRLGTQSAQSTRRPRPVRARQPKV